MTILKKKKKINKKLGVGIFLDTTACKKNFFRGVDKNKIKICPGNAGNTKNTAHRKIRKTFKSRKHLPLTWRLLLKY